MFQQRLSQLMTVKVMHVVDSLIHKNNHLRLILEKPNFILSL